MQFIPTSLLELRKSTGLSQLEFSRILGCSRSRFSRIECGILDLNQIEWIKLISQFPNSATLRITAEAQKESGLDLPKNYNNKSFLSSRVGNFFEQAIEDKLGLAGREKFWQTEKLNMDSIHLTQTPYPFELVLRMVQWLKINHCLTHENEIAELAKKAIHSELFWGRQWKWHQTETAPKKHLQFLENWKTYSQNHFVNWHNDHYSNLSFISFSPSHKISKNLYLHDFILQDFIGTWAKWWWFYFLEEKYTLNAQLKEETWQLKISMNKLH